MEEQNFIVAVLQSGIINRERLQECRQIQQQYRQQGHEISLPKILLKKRYISVEQLNLLTNAPNTARYFGRYQLLEKIGQGGMGQVYKVYDPQLQRVVALKTLILGDGAKPEEIVRFLREARATAQLRHPNIVTLYEIGNTEGPFFTMDFIDGKSLKNFATKPGFSMMQIAQLMIKIAKAIAYAHSQGIIHRDLKPDNVMVDKNGEPKVMDFGLAKLRKTTTKLSRTGMIVGTLQYMPPEQVSGILSAIDDRSDVYALGAILYQLMTGRPPFSGSNSINIIYKIVNDNPTAPTTLKRSIPKDMESICLKALEKEKEHRYQSAQEFANDLSLFVEGKPVKAKPVSFLSRSWKWMRRHRILSGAVVIVVSLVFALLVWHLYKQQQYSKRIAEGKQDVDNKNRELARKNSELEQQKKKSLQSEAQAHLSSAASNLVLAKLEIQRRRYFEAHNMVIEATNKLHIAKKLFVNYLESLDKVLAEKMVKSSLPIINLHKFLKQASLHMRHYCLDTHYHQEGEILSVVDNKNLQLDTWSRDLDSGKMPMSLQKQFAGSDHVLSPEFSIRNDQDQGWIVDDHQTRKRYSLRKEKNIFKIYECSQLPGKNPCLQASWNLQVMWDAGQTIIWDRNQNRELKTFKTSQKISAVAFSSDDKLIALGDHQHNIYLWNSQTDKLYCRKLSSPGKRGGIGLLQFSPDRQWLFSAMNKKIIVWKVPNMKPALVLPYGSIKARCDFSNDSKLLAIGKLLDRGIRVIDIARKKEVVKIDYNADALCFSKDNRELIMGTKTNLLVYPLNPNLQKIHEIKFFKNAHSRPIENIDISNDGDLLASIGQDSKLVVMDTYEYQKIFEVPIKGNHKNAQLSWHPKLPKLRVWNENYINLYNWMPICQKKLNLLNYFSKTEQMAFRKIQGNAKLRHVTQKHIIFSSKGRYIACFLHPKIYLLDLRNNSCHACLTIFFGDRYRNMGFSDDDSLFFWRGRDQSLVWRIQDKKLVYKGSNRKSGGIQDFHPQNNALLHLSFKEKPCESIIELQNVATARKEVINIADYGFFRATFTYRPETIVLWSKHGGTLGIVHMDFPKPKFVGHSLKVDLPGILQSVCYGLNGYLALGTDDGDFLLYNSQTKKIVYRNHFGEEIKCVTFIPDKKNYVIKTARCLYVYPHLADSALREDVERLYPLPLRFGYVLDIDADGSFRYVAILTPSGMLKIIPLF